MVEVVKFQISRKTKHFSFSVLLLDILEDAPMGES